MNHFLYLLVGCKTGKILHSPVVLVNRLEIEIYFFSSLLYLQALDIYHI